MIKNKTIISSGNGNYHMIFTATEIFKRKQLKLLICGLYPTKFFTILYNKVKFIIPSDKISIRKDKIPEIKIYSIWVSEIIIKLSNFFFKNFFKFLDNRIEYYGFIIFQKISLLVLKNLNLNDVKIFHFRSGFGGNCLKYLKKNKILTICDHGIAHPQIINYLIKNKGKFPKDNYKFYHNDYLELVEDDIKNSDYVLVNSNFVKKTFIKSNIPSKKIFVLEQGVEDKFLNTLKNKKISNKNKELKILFAGSLTERKGIFDIQKSLGYLKKTNFKIHLAGPLNLVTKSKLNRLLTDDKVVYHGNLNKKKLSKLMLNSDILILPSYVEGSPRVIFEAMACGCVIITTNNSGSIVKNNINGKIIIPGKPKQIANALKYYIKNKNIVKNIANRNKKLVINKFNQKAYGIKLIEIYNKINV
jgi:glycosyltransferase involved in cell wall biosynthesis